jgi:hypothetical protein
LFNLAKLDGVRSLYRAKNEDQTKRLSQDGKVNILPRSGAGNLAMPMGSLAILQPDDIPPLRPC